MKKLILTSAFCLSLLMVNAQAFEMGKSNVSVSYGFGSFTQALIKSAVSETDASFKSTGPIYAKYEYGLTEKIGIGFNFAYFDATISSRDQYTDVNSNTVNFTESLKYSTWSGLARLNFHFADNDRIDPYFGFGLGYRSVTYK